MSTTWKYQPPSPISRPIPTVAPSSTSMTWQATQLPGKARFALLQSAGGQA